MEVNQTQRLIDYLDVVKTPHAGAAEHKKNYKKILKHFIVNTTNEEEKTLKKLSQ